MADQIRVLLADDHPMLRAGLAALLQEAGDIEVAGQAGTGEEAVQLATALRPDVVVMDLTMPGGGGLDATRRIVQRLPATRVLVLSMHSEGEYLFPALDAGASGFLCKTGAHEELVRAIRMIATGEVFLDTVATRLVLEQLHVARDGGDGEAEGAALLSPREREVLALTAAGYTSAEIARQLSLSAKTVDTYRQRVSEKLHFHHRSELVRFAVREGLLPAAT